MSERGEITLFLAMILISVSALLCVIVESARTAGARCYLRMAVDSASDSLMAQYHRGLWENYRIFGLEYDRAESLEKEFEDFLQPYLETENWYPMRQHSTRFTDIADLTQGNGIYFQQEVLDYMKYGLFDTEWDAMSEPEAGKLLEDWKESGGVSRISQTYGDNTKGAVKLEKSLEAISETLENQKKLCEEAKECLEDLDGRGFIRKAEKIIKVLKKLPGQVNDYEKKADAMIKKLEEDRKKFEEESRDLREQTKSDLEEEIRQYESYVARDGERRGEVVHLKELSEKRTQWLENVIHMAEEVMEYIDNWEPEDEDDELDEEALWRPVKRQWNQYDMLTLGVKFGIEDKEKEGYLEQIGRMAASGLLELVLPEQTVVSGTALKLDGTPSRNRYAKQGSNKADKTRSPSGSEYSDETGKQNMPGVFGPCLDRLVIGEYGIRFFESFERELAQGDFYELEYIIQGKKYDRENLEGTVLRLVTLRSGLNMLHILADGKKRQEARGLALTVAGSIGMLPLVSILTFFIMQIWALGEALLDVRCLLEGGCIPFIKAGSDWRLDLDGLLEIGKQKSLAVNKAMENPGEYRDGSGQGKRKGVDYKGYLRILILGGCNEEMLYRLMDVIQMKIRRTEPDFRLDHCACNVDIETTVSGKHVFFCSGLWKNKENSYSYDVCMEVGGSYLEAYKSP